MRARSPEDQADFFELLDELELSPLFFESLFLESDDELEEPESLDFESDDLESEEELESDDDSFDFDFLAAALDREPLSVL
jgi:hypothetical protein